MKQEYRLKRLGLLSIFALFFALDGTLLAQNTPPSGGGGGSSVTIQGTANQITVTGAGCPAMSGTCTISIPSSPVIPNLPGVIPCAATMASNILACTPTQPITSYVPGMNVNFTASANNTATAYINISGIGNKVLHFNGAALPSIGFFWSTTYVYSATLNSAGTAFDITNQPPIDKLVWSACSVTGCTSSDTINNAINISYSGTVFACDWSAGTIPTGQAVLVQLYKNQNPTAAITITVATGTVAYQVYSASENVATVGGPPGTAGGDTWTEAITQVGNGGQTGQNITVQCYVGRS